MVILGTENPETLDGTVDNDTIFGLGGNDILNGLAGDDLLDGGLGLDQLFGGDGDDVLVQSTLTTGPETFDGGNGYDTLRLINSDAPTTGGAAGPLSPYNLFGATLTSIEAIEFASDVGTNIQAIFAIGQVGTAITSTTDVYGGAGTDTLLFVAGAAGSYNMPTVNLINWDYGETWYSDGDFMVLFGFGSADFTFNASVDHAGVEVLISGGGNDILNGGNGIDVLNGNGGVNSLFGNGGDDALQAINTFDRATRIETQFTFTDNIYDGGAGFDVLSTGGNVFFDGTLVSIEAINFLAAAEAPISPTGSPTSGNYEANLTMSAATVALLPANLVLAGTGTFRVINDEESGAAVNINASGWTYFEGTDVSVEFYGSGLADIVTGTSGDDYLDGNEGRDRLNGGSGNDYFEVEDGDIINGGDGIDTIEFNFQDRATGFAVNLTNLWTGGTGTITGGGTIVAIEVVSEIVGSNFNDTITVGVGYNGTTDIKGNDGVDRINGGSGVDILSGGAGDDVLSGFIGTDVLVGGADNDSLNGGAGNDKTYGGLGNDIHIIDSLSDRVVEYAGQGVDTVRTSVSGYTLAANVETLTLLGSVAAGTGNRLDNRLNGNTAANTLSGGDGNDTILGLAGNDTLNGDAGDDRIYGGAGRDTMTGGDGRDSYYFEAGDFAGLTGNSADRITDFVQGSDRIRFNLIDANVDIPEDQAFSFIGTAAFSNVAGQLRYSQNNGVTLILGDTNGDSVADFALALTGLFTLQQSDFVL